jgi:hypothetical protein
MEKKVFLVEERDEGSRLDLFLSSMESGLSRSFIQKLCLVAMFM